MIKVLSSGFYSTIQDLGRFGYQKYGVPCSGVMDKQSASFANAILGNNQDSSVLEITMSGPKLQFNCNTSICISGADMSPKINGNPIKNNKLIAVSNNDILSFGKLKTGYRVYLAIKGGFITKSVMNSYSMFYGITKAFRLIKNDILKVVENEIFTAETYASIKVDSTYLESKNIEVFKGPEFEKLTKQQKNTLFSQEFTISKDNNRMAYQLNEILENTLESIITSPVIPGTIQLTPSGKLIVLMKDCQTTGGYPRILQLKESSIDLLAQKYTGQSIFFKQKI